MAAFAGFALGPTAGTAAGVGDAPLLAYDQAALQPAAAIDAPAPSAPLPSTATVDAVAQPAIVADAGDEDDGDISAAVDPASLDCMAKIVFHESRGQPRQGQIAVAQTLVHRLKSGRFGDTICEVANQPGQYFNTAGFHPRRDNADWKTALDVAHDVLSGEADTVAPGAMFFRATYSTPNSFFRSRKSVTTIGGHVFYR